ncbi:MAG: DUF6605 domain-containing protein [Chloroflexota bacterium]
MASLGLTRRRLLIAAVWLGAASAWGRVALDAWRERSSPPGFNPIVPENAQAGSDQWQMVTQPQRRDVIGGVIEGGGDVQAAGPSRWDPPPISGYADRTSVEPGGKLTFFVSTTAPLFDVTISRMGWYGGDGGRLLHQRFGLAGRNQPVPPPHPETGLVEARWQPSFTLDVPADWVSGLYLVRLLATNNTHDVGYVVFVVRDDRQPADFVYKVAFNTYQAYNPFGGKSLYDFNSVGGRATKVSFDRPYDQWFGSGDFFNWDFPMIRWLEREGYNVTYISDVDAHADAAYLRGRRALLSVGHDEYWSREMRDAWERARDGGTSLAFFSGNIVYWQVRFEPSSTGAANRTMVCYKEAVRDPLYRSDDARVTVLWQSQFTNRPENALAGVQSGHVVGFGVDLPYIVKAADHWLFAGTGAAPDQQWSSVVGYEVDQVYDNGRSPDGLVILSETPVTDTLGRPGKAHSTYYRKGGMVFAAGTVNWAWGLDNSRGRNLVDPRIQRLTANLLDAFKRGGPPPGAG